MSPHQCTAEDDGRLSQVRPLSCPASGLQAQLTTGDEGLRCYVITSSVVVMALLLGVATIVAEELNGLCALPGVVVLDGWVVVMVRRRRQPTVDNTPP